MGERLIEMAGWHPSDFVDLWNEQSDDPFSDVSIEAGVDDDYLEFTANDVGTDFEIRVLVNNAELDVANEVQEILITRATGGTFTITFDGQTTSGIAYNASAGTVQTALEALSNIASGDVEVTAVTGGYRVEFKGAYLGLNVTAMTVNGASLTGGTVSVTISTVRTYTSGASEVVTFFFDVTQTVSPLNETQKVTIGGNPSSGNFTLTFDGQTTGNIAYNASNATVLAALEALSNIGSGDVAVTGGPLPNRPITIEFKGSLAGDDVPQMTGSAGTLGGTGANLAITTTTPGQASTTKLRFVFNTTTVSSGNWYFKWYNPSPADNDGEAYVRTANFAYNANNATIKTALAGYLQQFNDEWDDNYQPGTGVSSWEFAGGHLCSEAAITLTNSLGNSAFTLEFDDSVRPFYFSNQWANLSYGNTLVLTNGTTVITPTVTNFTGSATVEIQSLYPTGIVPTSGNFNLDYDGTNTANQNLNAGAITPAIVETLLNDAVANPNEINQTTWMFYSYYSQSVPEPQWHKFNYPMEVADLSSVTAFAGQFLYLLTPFGAYTYDYITSYFINEVGNNVTWREEVVAAFNAAIAAEIADRNKMFTCYGSNIVPGTDTGAISIRPNVYANGFAYTDLTELIVESASAPTPTITITTLIEGGTTEISGITGGTFAIVIVNDDTGEKYTVGNIAWDAEASDVEDAINDFFGSTVVSATGGPLPLTEVTLTFEGTLANTSLTVSLIPSFGFTSLEGGITPTVVNEANPPEDRANSYILTIAPGVHSVTPAKGYIVFRSTIIGTDGLNKTQEVSVNLDGITPAAIEEAFEEMFGFRAVHVVQIAHTLRHENVSTSPYTDSPVTHHWWFYEDQYHITWLAPYELAEFVTSFVLSSIPNFATLIPTREVGDDESDASRESYKSWLGFKTANDAGTPKHIVSLAFSGTESDNTCTYGFIVEPQYMLSSGELNISRTGIAQTMMNRQIRFLWCGVNQTASAGAHPTDAYTVLARSMPVDWNAEPQQIKHVLERLIIRLTGTLPTDLGSSSIEDLDDADTAYSPIFFGSGNIEVTGNLQEGTLLVKLVERLARANFNFYAYQLVAEVINDDFAWNTPVDDPAQPEPRIFSFEMSKVFQNGQNTIVRYELADTSPVVVSYNGQSTELTNTMSRRQIQQAINLISTLGQMFEKTTGFDPNDDRQRIGGSTEFYTSTTAGVLTRPSATDIIIPPKLARSVTVSGTVANRSISLEMSGYGMQFSKNMVAVGNEALDSFINLTVDTEGSTAGTESQRITITPTDFPPTSGTFKLSVDSGSTKTAAIDFDATADEVAAAVTALGSSTACTGSGGPLPVTPVTLVFTDESNIPTMTVHDSTLKNGTATASVIFEGGYEGTLVLTDETPGYGPNFLTCPDNWTDRTAPESGDTLVFDMVGGPIEYGLRQSYTFKNIGSNFLALTPRRKAFYEGQKVYVSSSGTLPSGLSAGYYYVRNPAANCSLQLSSTRTGSIVSISGLGSGTHRIELRELVVQVHKRWPGRQIGLPFTRSTELSEHLCPYFKAGFTSIEIGIGSGDNPVGMAKFDTLDQATTITIHESDSSSEGSIPAVCLLTDNATTTIEADNASLGIAMQSGESSELDSIEVGNSEIVLRNVTADTLTVKEGSTQTLFQCQIANMITII
jgi:hypothetical protein